MVTEFELISEAGLGGDRQVSTADDVHTLFESTKFMAVCDSFEHSQATSLTVEPSLVLAILEVLYSMPSPFLGHSDFCRPFAVFCLLAGVLKSMSPS